MTTAPVVLEVSDLSTHFFTKQGIAKAVDKVSFSLKKGEIMGLVGESGSGKSVTGFSILGLVDSPGKVVGGSVKLYGEELIGADEEVLRRMRGSKIAMVFQDPMMTLNPVLRVDTQMVEAVRAHEKISRQAALSRSEQALSQVGIASPRERLTVYPHELSGGMRQRVAIAIAMLHRPGLIIADEPTTALDVTIQGQILYEMQQLCAETGTALIWITHDLAVVAGLADRLAVMYAGNIVELGGIDEVLDTPHHPYTHGLINSAPNEQQLGKALFQIPGMAPSLLNLPQGCAFQPRCPRAVAQCNQAQRLTEHGKGRFARCCNPHL